MVTLDSLVGGQTFSFNQAGLGSVSWVTVSARSKTYVVPTLDGFVTTPKVLQFPPEHWAKRSPELEQAIAVLNEKHAEAEEYDLYDPYG